MAQQVTNMTFVVLLFLVLGVFVVLKFPLVTLTIVILCMAVAGWYLIVTAVVKEYRKDPRALKTDTLYIGKILAFVVVELVAFLAPVVADLSETTSDILLVVGVGLPVAITAYVIFSKKFTVFYWKGQKTTTPKPPESQN